MTFAVLLPSASSSEIYRLVQMVLTAATIFAVLAVCVGPFLNWVARLPRWYRRLVATALALGIFGTVLTSPPLVRALLSAGIYECENWWDWWPICWLVFGGGG